MRFFLSILMFLSIHSASFASVTEPDVRWSEDQFPIKVCFGKYPEDVALLGKQSRKYLEEAKNSYGIAFQEGASFFDGHKSFIKDLITSQYTKSRTGVHFSGFDTCTEVLDPDIVILPIISWDDFGLSAVGRGDFDWKSRRFKKSDDEGAQFILLRYYPPQEIKGWMRMRLGVIALHEFGHAAGLRHEWIRKSEMKKDPYCQIMDMNNRHRHEPKFLSTKYTSEYDPNSIMNYCFTRRLHRFGAIQYSYSLETEDRFFPFKDPNQFEEVSSGDEIVVTISPALSVLDVHSLRCLYIENYRRTRNCGELLP